MSRWYLGTLGTLSKKELVACAFLTIVSLIVFNQIKYTPNQKQKDFKECVDLTHSAVWCYEKIR